MKFDSKHKIKAKNQRYRNIKMQNTDRRKPSFPKKQEESTDLSKPVLKKIMTTRE